MRTVRVKVDPLRMPSLELASRNEHEEQARVLSRILCEFLSGDPLSVMEQRYAGLDPQQLRFVPDLPGIDRDILRPLREAQKCYILGMPVACIAQCGLVGEMLALLRFKMLHPKLDGHPFDEDKQKLLMGRTFEKLGQEQRIKVLKVLDDLDQDTITAFDKLRAIRTKYLHFMSAEHSNEKLNVAEDQDARIAFSQAVLLVSKTLNGELRDGKLMLPDKVKQYLRGESSPE